MNKYGFVRITVVTPKIKIADPGANVDEHIRILEQTKDSDIVLFPELGITGYTCGDYFHQEAMLQKTWEHIIRLCGFLKHDRRLVVVGAPMALDNSLHNCAVALNDGAPCGIVPKPFIPNYNEFYEGRYFPPGFMARSKTCNPVSGFQYITERWTNIPFGTDLLFRYQINQRKVTIGFELCEAMWMPIPPSSIQAVLGAVIHLNPSASTETIRKDVYREALVIGQSGRCISAYAYASAGPTESSSDVIFGGHRIIAEAGSILANESSIMPEVNRESAWTTVDVDVDKLWHERRVTTSYNTSLEFVKDFEPRWVDISLRCEDGKTTGLKRKVDATPFVPKDPKELSARCKFICNMQVAGLAQRLSELPYQPKLVLGTSGGADSTHAAVILRRTCDLMKIDATDRVRCFSLPGFGTSPETFDDSLALPRALGFPVSVHDIRPACYQKFLDMGYQPFGLPIRTMKMEEFCESLKKLPPGSEDLTFENVQALYRKDWLFDHGFVIGTSDMSEAFLGWCTYCADQQAAYHVNIGIPKTLIKWLISYQAETVFTNTRAYQPLVNVAGRKFSPELLPLDLDGKMVQITESKIGPYEIHEFIMLNMLKYGYDPEKILWLADHAQGWEGEYTPEIFTKWMESGIKRFFGQQYKRENVPNGVKVGSLALSPRGDLRLPPGASPIAWLQFLQR
jgi:NAD+ synthase (glutamine-hydrolysing)